MPGSSTNSHRRFLFALLTAVAWAWNGAATAAAGAGANDPQVAGAPRLTLAETVIDLGSTLEGDPLSACFSLRNGGGGTLHIEAIKPGCGCTRVDHPRRIEPGERASICMTIDTSGRHGRQTFNTAVQTNDPDFSSIVLRVKTTITPLVTLTPDRIFLRGAARDRLRQTIDIATLGHAPLTVSIESHDLGENIRATLTAVEEKRRYRLELRNRRTGAGSYRGRLLLRTDHPGQERIVVPVFAHLTEPVATYPSELVLDRGKCPACRDQRLFSGSLTVRAHDDRALVIRAIGPNQTGLSHRIETLVPERAYRISVRYAASDALPLPAELIIETNRKDRSPISVPLRLNP